MPAALTGIAMPAPFFSDSVALSSSGYNFPAASWILPIKGGPNSSGTQLDVMLIWGAGAPSTNYNNAPNGSLYTDMTNFKLYIKTASATWTVVGSQS